MQILDQNGQPVEAAQTVQERAVVFVSETGDDWEPVKPYNVPDWVKREEVMGDMMRGEIVSLDEAGPFYCAKPLGAIH